MNAYDDEPDESTIECPYCAEEVYDDAERCPACGNYLSSEDQNESSSAKGQFTKQPVWVIITAIVLIYAMLHVYIWPIVYGILN